MITIQDRGSKRAGALAWPGELPDSSLKPESEALYVYLLDADDDLAAEFDVRTLIAARQLATAKAFDVEVGDCDLSHWFGAVGDGPGLMILEGLMAVDARIDSRTASELVGAGDLLQPTGRELDDLLERTDAWHALSPVRLALLDADFAERIRPWPQIMQALLRRAGRRMANIDALRAIACQPRLEVRLVLLFWLLAARWGRVEPAGIHLSLPLTHRLIGQLVGAERPSVSHALGRLGRGGLVVGSAGDWHLTGTVDEQLECLSERSSALAGHTTNGHTTNGATNGHATSARVVSRA